jgi:hypothetical protein
MPTHDISALVRNPGTLPPLRMTVHCDLKNPRLSALVHEPGESRKGYSVLTIDHTPVNFSCEEEGRHGRRGKIVEHFLPKDAGDLKAQVLHRLQKFAHRCGVHPENIAYLASDEAGERSVPGLELPPYWRDPSTLRILQDNAARRQKADNEVRALHLCVEADKQLDLKRNHKGRQILRMARELAPDFFWPYMGLAEAAMGEGRVSALEVEGLLAQARKLLPECPFPEKEMKKFEERIRADIELIAKARAQDVEHLREAVLRPALPAPSNKPAPPPAIDISISFDPPSLPSSLQGRASRNYLNARPLEILNPEEKLLRKFRFIRLRPVYKEQRLEETAHALFSFAGSHATDGGPRQALAREVAFNLSTGLENATLRDQWKGLLLDEKPAYEVTAPFALPNLSQVYTRVAESVRQNLDDAWREAMLQRHDGDHRAEGVLELKELRLLYQPCIRVEFEFQSHEAAVSKTFIWDPVVKEFADAACEGCGAVTKRFFLNGAMLCCEDCSMPNKGGRHARQS